MSWGLLRISRLWMMPAEYEISTPRWSSDLKDCNTTWRETCLLPVMQCSRRWRRRSEFGTREWFVRRFMLRLVSGTTRCMDSFLTTRSTRFISAGFSCTKVSTRWRRRCRGFWVSVRMRMSCALAGTWKRAWRRRWRGMCGRSVVVTRRVWSCWKICRTVSCTP